jgi:hypothetical protein
MVAVSRPADLVAVGVSPDSELLRGRQPVCEPSVMDAGPLVPQVVQLSLRARVLAPIRGGLSALAVVAAVLDGVRPGTALLAWPLGAILVSMVLAGNPRGRRTTAPEPLPSEAVPESWAQIARTDVVPSTVGVALLTSVALVLDPVVACVLAGILGGMALMTMVSRVQLAVDERRLGGVLYVERRSKRLYLLEPGPEADRGPSSIGGGRTARSRPKLQAWTKVRKGEGGGRQASP